MTTSSEAVLVMIPRVQSLLKLVSLREITEGRKNRVVLSMIPRVQSLLKSVSVEKLHKINPLWKVVLVMTASV